MSKQDVFRLIAQLRASEEDKTACGRRLIKFYERLANGEK